MIGPLAPLGTLSSPTKIHYDPDTGNRTGTVIPLSVVEPKPEST